MDRVSTGVKGLDEMLKGGLLPKRPYVITGPPGSGKTTLGIHFLMEGLKEDQNVVLVAMDEPPNEININAQTMGFDMDYVRILDAVPDVKTYKRGSSIKDVGTILDFHIMRDVRDIRMSKKLRAMDVSIHTVQKMLRQDADDLYEETGERYSRVVVDSMTALKMFGMGGEDHRVLIQSFMRFLAELEVTALIITQQTDPEHLDTEILLARGEIRLHKTSSRETTHRGVSIEKFRGSAFDDNIRPLRITSGGMKVLNKELIYESEDISG